MRLPRGTYAGAFHHGMNRGYEGGSIFGADLDKVFFLGSGIRKEAPN
jgi:hypothetical protein